MTIDQLATEVPELSEEQLEGTACADCATADGPLHRGETVTTRVDDGVVRDSTVVRCTRCLVARRRPASTEVGR